MAGCPTLVVGGWVLGFLRLGVCDAERTEAHLRPWSSAFSHVQLLSAVAAAEDGARAAVVRAGTWAGLRGVRISAGGICGDARACAFADQRAEERHALDGVADVEAARVAEDAEEEPEGLSETTAVGVCGAVGRPARILAGALLRLQRLHEREKTREAGVHAQQSGDAETGGTCEGLALEQLVVLRER